MLEVLALVAQISSGGWETAALSVRLSADSVFLDEPVTAMIEIASVGAELDFANAENIPLADLQLVGASHARSRETRNGRNIYRDIFTYALRPTAIGMCYVQPFSLRFTSSADTVEHRLITPALEVLVRKRPEPTSRAGALTLLAAVLVLVGAAVAVALRRRRHAVAAPVVEDRDAIVAKFVEKASDLKWDDVRGGSKALFDLLREFLRAYYAIDDPLPTVAGVRNFLRSREIAKLDEFLDEFDRATFGKDEPAGGIEIHRMRIKNFLREFKSSAPEGGHHESGN